MSDLQVNPYAVQRVRDKAIALESSATQGLREVGRLTADGLGPADLVARVASFGEQWTTALRQLGESAASIARSVEVAEQEIEAVDDALASRAPRAE